MLNKLSRLSNFLDEFYVSKYRGMIYKDKRQIDDFFMIITFGEMMGIPNPYEFYTIELMIELMPEFHKWHKSVGLNKSPFENFPCFCCC